MTKRQPGLNLPNGFEYHDHLFGRIGRRLEEMSLWRFLLWANLLALLPLSGLLITLWLPYQFYLAQGAPLALYPDLEWSPIALAGVGFILLVGSIALHEFLHGIALLLTGHRPRFFLRYGVPHADIPEGHFLTRREYLAMALAPFVVMTLSGGMLIFFLPPTLGKMLLAILLLNSAASVGDLYVARQVRLSPASALFAAGDGIQVFLPRNVSVAESN